MSIFLIDSVLRINYTNGDVGDLFQKIDEEKQGRDDKIDHCKQEEKWKH